MRIQVIFHSIYGHTYRLAEAVAEGVREFPEAEVSLFQVAELIPDRVLERTGAKKAREAFAHIPVATPEKMTEADAILFGTSTRFGMMSAQMRHLLDPTADQWNSGALTGKVGSVFTSGDHRNLLETTITTIHAALLLHGMLIAGPPYAEIRQMTMDESSGPGNSNSPPREDGPRMPAKSELASARLQGRRIAQITAKLTG